MIQRLIVKVAPVERLAETVALLGLHRPIVLSLPPSGLLTASRVARELQAPLDMFLPSHVDTPIRVDRGIAWPMLAGRSAVIVDDGSAYPMEWHSALASLQLLQPDCLAIVVPAMSDAIQRALNDECRDLFCPGVSMPVAGEIKPMAQPARGRKHPVRHARGRLTHA